MKLLIDCSNIGFGGGLTHIIELVYYIEKKEMNQLTSVFWLLIKL